MSKFLIAAAMLLASIQPAFATSTFAELNLAQPEAVQQQDDTTTRYARGGGIVGGIIGGIIGGLIIADQMDRYPGRYRDIVCYAEDRRGRTFRAFGSRARATQERALDKCYDVSRFCRPLGCEGR